MAKQLPQFKAATPAYQQQRVVRQPNYADIYARSYANTVLAYTRLYQPLLSQVDKLNTDIKKEKKEKELRQQKAQEVGLTYQNAIYTGIDEKLAGKFEDKFKKHLSKNADAFTQNELDHANGKVSFDIYSSTKKKLYSELNDTEKAAQTMRQGLEFFTANKDNMSLYQNSKLFGLFEAFESGGRNIEIGRNKLGNTIYSYIDQEGAEQSFTLDEVNELVFGETENALNLKIDYKEDGSEGKTILDALENSVRTSEGFQDVQTETFSVTNPKGNQRIDTTSTAYKDTQYIIKSAQNSDLLESVGESYRARHYQDEMLNPRKGSLMHNLNITANEVINYLKVNEGEDYTDKKDDIMRLISSYTEDDNMAREDAFIGSVRKAQKQLVKADIANKMFNERFAIDEKPTQVNILNITDNQKRSAKLVNGKNFVDTVDNKFGIIKGILNANFDLDDGVPQGEIKDESGNTIGYGGEVAIKQLYGLFGSAITQIENNADEIGEGKNQTMGDGYIEFTLNKDAIGASKDMKIKIDNNTPASYLAELLWSINDVEGNAKDIYDFWNNKQTQDWSGERDTRFYDWITEKSTYYQTELDKIGYTPGDEDFN